MSTKIKFNHNGATEEIPLVEGKPAGKRFAIYHNGGTYYAPLVPTTDSAASDIHLVFGGDTLALPTAETPVEIIESFNFNNNTKPARSTAVTLLGNYGDFGVFADSSQPEGYNVTLTNGIEYYGNIVSITATQPNSTIIGNTEHGEIAITGGSGNFIICGMGLDSISFDSSGGVIADYGNGVEADGAGKDFTLSTNTTGYNRYNTGSYYNGVDYLFVTGEVTAVYYDTSTSVTKQKKISTLDIVITYTDTNGTDQIILLKDVTKNCSTRNTTSASKRVFATNSATAASCRIYHGTDTFVKIIVSNYTANLANFPESLRPALINLYNIYGNSGYTNSNVTMGVYTQVLPDWIPQ